MQLNVEWRINFKIYLLSLHVQKAPISWNDTASHEDCQIDPCVCVPLFEALVTLALYLPQHFAQHTYDMSPPRQIELRSDDLEIARCLDARWFRAIQLGRLLSMVIERQRDFLFTSSSHCNNMQIMREGGRGRDGKTSEAMWNPTVPPPPHSHYHHVLPSHFQSVSCRQEDIVIARLFSFL